MGHDLAMLRADSTAFEYCSSACATARYSGRSRAAQSTHTDGGPAPDPGSRRRPGNRSSCLYTALG